jgi:glycerol-3-phosphate dehydrogenase (NAD(P)+)
MKKTVTVLGAGSWGTAVATLLAENGYDVTLWSHEKEVTQSIETERVNRCYLPDVQLSSRIKSTDSLEEAFLDSQLVFEVIPIAFLRSVLTRAKPFVTATHRWCLLSKGIEQDTLMFSSEILNDIFGEAVMKSVLSGPNCAAGLVKQQLTATMLAGDVDLVDALIPLLKNHYFIPYRSSDIIGVQISGALKNVIALLIGIAEGAGLGPNAKAWVGAAGLNEIADITEALGGNRETAFGLAGLGDLMVSSMPSGRNFQLGKAIGAGASIEEAQQKIKGSLEGINTTKSLYRLLERKNIELPLCRGLYKILFERETVSSLISSLS